MSAHDREERKRLYRTERWRQMSKAFIKANPTCIDCGKRSKVTDHSVGHSIAGWRERFFVGPFEPRRWTCHARKTTRTEQGHKPDGSFAAAGALVAGAGGRGGRLAAYGKGSPTSHKGIANILGQAKVGSAEAFAQKIREKWQQESSSTKE